MDHLGGGLAGSLLLPSVEHSFKISVLGNLEVRLRPNMEDCSRKIFVRSLLGTRLGVFETQKELLVVSTPQWTLARTDGAGLQLKKRRVSRAVCHI